MKLTHMNVEIMDSLLDLSIILKMHGIKNIAAIRECRSLVLIINTGAVVYKLPTGVDPRAIDFTMVKKSDFNELKSVEKLTDKDIVICLEPAVRNGVYMVTSNINFIDNKYICEIDNTGVMEVSFKDDYLDVKVAYDNEHPHCCKFEYIKKITEQKEEQPETWRYVKTLCLLNGMLIIDDRYTMDKLHVTDKLLPLNEESDTCLLTILDEAEENINAVSNLIKKTTDQKLYILKKAYGFNDDDLYDPEYIVMSYHEFIYADEEFLKGKSVIIDSNL